MDTKATDLWHNLPYSSEPADMQLAAGTALLQTLPAPDSQPAPRPLLRWYSMHAPSLILGSGQKLHEFDLAACRAAGVQLYRRSSGGTAVLAEPDQVLLDIALPASHPLYRHDVTESYRWLGEAWVAALAALGVPARLIAVAEARADTQTLDALTRRSCYGGRSPYEVLADGRKLVGLAQVRRRQGALLQTGIYTTWAPQRLANLLLLSPAEREALTARLAARVIGLADVLPRPRPAPSSEEGSSFFRQLRQAFAAALQSLHGVALVETPWNAALLDARARAAARYAPLDEDG